jgi:hypothetical protein
MTVGISTFAVVAARIASFLVRDDSPASSASDPLADEPPGEARA